MILILITFIEVWTIEYLFINLNILFKFVQYISALV